MAEELDVRFYISHTEGKKSSLKGFVTGFIEEKNEETNYYIVEALIVLLGKGYVLRGEKEENLTSIQEAKYWINKEIKRLLEEKNQPIPLYLEARLQFFEALLN